MTYIILAAGTGSRLNPITLKHPKTLFSLDDKTTILQRMVSSIKDMDKAAKVVIICGFKHKLLKEKVSDVYWVYNPFYKVTNSLGSLWCAREHLKDDVTIINGDIVMSYELMKDIIVKPVKKPCVLIDTSIKNDGDYNIQLDEDKVVVMSKELTSYSGEYAGVTKLNTDSAKKLCEKLDEMVEDGRYTTWYEDALVQMIFENNFELFATDISNYEWTEVDSVDDLVYAKRIHRKQKV